MKRFVIWLVLAAVVHVGHRYFDQPENHNRLGTPLGSAIIEGDAQTTDRIDRAVDRIEAHLRNHDLESLVGLSPPMPESDIRRIRDAINSPIPESLRALWRRHGGSRGEFFSPYVLYDADHVISDWRFHQTDEFGFDFNELRPQVESAGWTPHPAWIPFAGWDVYTLYVNGETGGVLYHDDDNGGGVVQSESLPRWLENIANRLDRGDLAVDPPKPPGSRFRHRGWDRGQHYQTPGGPTW